MKTTVRRLGNSHGVLIPRPFLAEIGLDADDPVEMKIKKGRLVVAPLKKERRASWAADSKRLAQAGEAGAAWPADERGAETEAKPGPKP